MRDRIPKRVEYLLLLLWTVMVLPFTFLGYGSDGDAWLVAQTSRRIWQSHAYFRSRTTGFPLFEIGVAPLVEMGQWYLSNLLPLLGGGAVLLAFFYMARKRRLAHPVLTVICFGFLPVIVKNSSSTMDYLPALALLLWAYTMMLEECWILSGILIGIACGFRLSSLAFIVPVCLYIWLEKRQIMLLVRLLFAAVISGFLAYSPALLKYGIPNIHGAIQLDRVSLLLVGGYNFLSLFGIVQTLALGGFLLAGLNKARQDGSLRSSEVLFHLTNCCIWIILFVQMPDEPEYLMPLVPSIILLIDRWATRRAFFWLTVLLLSYHVVQFDVLGGESGRRVIHPAIRPGYTVADVQDRRFKLSTRQAATVCRVSTPTVLMLGGAWIPAANDAWTYDTQQKMFRQKNGQLYVSGRIRDELRLQELKHLGFRLVVWQNEKWEYFQTKNTFWQNYIEVVDDLDTFFGMPIVGNAINQR